MPQATERDRPQKLSFSTFLRNSDVFSQRICKFPAEGNRVSRYSACEIEPDIAATRVCTHVAALALAENVVNDFKHRDTPLGDLYRKNPSPTEVWHRLLTQRPVACWLSSDSFLLRNGESGWGGLALTKIGTSSQAAPLTLVDYLSPEETLLASFLQISSPVRFVNSGGYPQTSQQAPKGSFTERGVCIGVCAPRLDTPGRPDWWHMVVTPEQNTVDNGYGPQSTASSLALWAEFYGQGENAQWFFPTFEAAARDPVNFVALESPKCLLNSAVYRRRLRLALETAFLEADHCGRRENRRVFVHMAPLGLDRLGRGWCAKNMFTWGAKVLVETAVAVLQSHSLEYIDTVHFDGLAQGVGAEQLLPSGCATEVTTACGKHSVQLSFAHRKFAATLANPEHLLVLLYTADSTALVGNEYWVGQASFSNSSAVAAFSTIPEMHNPYINTMLTSSAIVSWPERQPDLSFEEISQRFQYVPDRFADIADIQDALSSLGLGSCNLIVGFDYTASNKDQGKRTFNGKSLHHIDPKLANPYQQVTAILARTLQKFDDDNLIPAFGFGDYETSDKDVFPFFPDGRPCDGLDELLSQYTLITPKRILAGPTNFAPLIDKAVEITKQEGGYHILVIIADGRVTEEDQTVQAIRRASHFPLSIICVGVGDGPWDQMEDFDDRIQDRVFDNFQFVDFHKITTTARRPETSFAHAALMEIPQQYCAIKQLGFLQNTSASLLSSSTQGKFLHFADKYHDMLEVRDELERVGLQNRISSFVLRDSIIAQ